MPYGEESHMGQFENLQTLYDYLELNALNYDETYQIAELFSKFKNMKHQDNAEEAEKAQWLINAFYFGAINGELVPLYEVPDQNGMKIEFPILDRFDERGLQFLEERLEATSNPLLKSRYAHILWAAKKHGSYGKKAVDSYISLIDSYRSRLELINDHHEINSLADNLAKTIRNAYCIAKKIKYDNGLKIVKQIIEGLAFNCDIYNKLLFLLWTPLIELMIYEHKAFNRDDFEKVAMICQAIGIGLLSKGNTIAAIRIFQLGESAEAKLGIQSPEWKRKIAECYEFQMNQSESEPMVALRFCQQALITYRMIKDTTKTRELEGKYIYFRKNIRLNSHEFTIDVSSYREKLEGIAENILLRNNIDIIKILTFNKDLVLPKYEEIKQSVNDLKEEYPLNYVFPTAHFDDNANIAEYFSAEDGNIKRDILQSYRMMLEIKTIPMLNTVLLGAVVEKELSLDSFLYFFKQHFWFGQRKSKIFPNGRIINCSWLDLIAPSLNDYFYQVKYYLATGNQPNLILSIDSLTLKLEGLIRELCKYSEIATFALDRNGVPRERDTTSLLHDAKIDEIFEVDDLLFLRFY